MIIDLGLFIDETLIIADTQLGYEESLNKQGVLIPRNTFQDLLVRLEKMITTCKPKKIIINGDVKHEFGGISRTEWNDTLELLDMLQSHAEVEIVKGNHDTILEPIARKRGIVLKPYTWIGKTLVCHGHKVPATSILDKAEMILIGHVHPAVALRDHGRVERFKCFLKGEYDGKELWVLPSCNLLVEGTDVLTEKVKSPFLSEIGGFEVFVEGEYFGTVKDLMNTQP